MEDKLTLGDRITYKEQMLRVYEDALYKESKYRMTLKQEREKNDRKFKIYLAAVIILVLLDFAALYIAGGKFLKSNPTSDAGVIISIGIGGISALVGFVMAAFTFIGTAICSVKLVHYGKRLNKEMDNRDFIWRSYDEMIEISNRITEETVAEKTKMAAELELDKTEARRQAEQLRLEYEDGKDEQKTISMSELFYVKSWYE